LRRAGQSCWAVPAPRFGLVWQLACAWTRSARSGTGADRVILLRAERSLGVDISSRLKHLDDHADGP
jgi:hypothetical protein